VCWDPHREGQVGALNRVQKRATKFAINVNESSWETLAQRRLIDKYTMMYQSNTTKLYYVYYCIRATCFDSYRIILRPF